MGGGGSDGLQSPPLEDAGGSDVPVDVALSFGPQLERTVNTQGVRFGRGLAVQLLCSSVGKPKPNDGFST